MHLGSIGQNGQQSYFVKFSEPAYNMWYPRFTTIWDTALKKFVTEFIGFLGTFCVTNLNFFLISKKHSSEGNNLTQQREGPQFLLSDLPQGHNEIPFFFHTIQCKG